MVVTFLPTADCAVVMHDRTATPSTCTVHAPHWPSPHPNFEPVRPRFSRSTQSSGMSPLTSTLWRLPFTSRAIMLRAPCRLRASGLGLQRLPVRAIVARSAVRRYCWPGGCFALWSAPPELENAAEHDPIAGDCGGRAFGIGIGASSCCPELPAEPARGPDAGRRRRRGRQGARRDRDAAGHPVRDRKGVVTGKSVHPG